MEEKYNYKLLNKKGLNEILRKKEMRVGSDALKMIREEIKNFSLILLDSSREEMKISGKRTLGTEQVKKAIKKISERNNFFLV